MVYKRGLEMTQQSYSKPSGFANISDNEWQGDGGKIDSFATVLQLYPYNYQ